MIEIPEAKVLANQMQRILKNKKIIDVTKEQSPHKFAFFNKDIASYADILIGSTIENTTGFGGYVEVDLGTYSLTYGEGVNLRYITHESDLPKKHQLLLHFSDGTYLVASIQMYGMVWLFKKGDFDNFYYTVALDKPSPLSAAFTKEYFDQLFDSCSDTISVKAFLATEQRIPGLGNGVLQDILFNAKVHPKRKLFTLNQQNKQALFDSITSTLHTMLELGGRNTERDLFGNYGKYQTILSNKTVKYPCSVCNGELVKKTYLGGAIYYCPSCQKEL